MGLSKKKQPKKTEKQSKVPEKQPNVQAKQPNVPEKTKFQHDQIDWDKWEADFHRRQEEFDIEFKKRQEEFQRKWDESEAMIQKIKEEEEAEKKRRAEEKQRAYEEQCRKEKEEEERYYNVKTVATLTESEQRVLNNLGATKSARNLFSFGLAGLLIPCNGGKTDKTEVDVLEINESGLFVMECKDYKANIAGKENDPGWTREQDGRIESFHNPIKQNENHIKAINALLIENGIYNVPIYSVIVFSNRGNISGIEVTMPNVAVCQDGQIRDVLDAMGAQTKNKLSHSDVKYIYDILAPYRFATGAERDEHIQQIKNSAKAESNMSMDNESLTENNTY